MCMIVYLLACIACACLAAQLKAVSDVNDKEELLGGDFYGMDALDNSSGEDDDFGDGKEKKKKEKKKPVRRGVGGGKGGGGGGGAKKKPAGGGAKAGGKPRAKPK
eukprot:SAG22_NODE_9785_length_569_cov_1.708511_2_plen_104_part_01